MKSLLPHVPSYEVYVEVFGGGASLLFALPPAKVEVYNDLDGGLFDFFSVLRDPEKFGQFYGLAMCSPYSRRLYDECRETWEGEQDVVVRAWKWFVVARQSFSGVFGNSWGYGIVKNVVNGYFHTIENLPKIHKRIMGVQIECNDFQKVLEAYDSPRTFFYCDPPYAKETRRQGGYKHEMSAEDHVRLVDCLLKVRGKVILSGYANEEYKRLEQAGWPRMDYDVFCSAVGKTKATGLKGAGSMKNGQERVESIWLNFQKKLDLGSSLVPGRGP